MSTYDRSPTDPLCTLAIHSLRRLLSDLICLRQLQNDHILNPGSSDSFGSKNGLCETVFKGLIYHAISLVDSSSEPSANFLSIFSSKVTINIINNSSHIIFPKQFWLNLSFLSTLGFWKLNRVYLTPQLYFISQTQTE